MSSQSLRDLLDAELAALSDCDDDELNEHDSELCTTSYNGTATVENSPFSSDVTDKTRSLDEWQLLIESSEQAERRFQSMSVMLSDGFHCAGKHSQSEAESAIGIQYQASSNGSNHDPTISWYLDNLASACGEESLLSNDLTPNMGYGAALEDENLRAEVIELMNSMIEAVLSSAPSVRAPLLQLQLMPQVVDWSLLPKILQDDTVLDDAVVSFSELNTTTGIADDGEDDEQSKNIIERKIQLKIAQDNLLLISNRANEVALQRKRELLERKRCMEEELGLFKKETSSVLIQSKWREYRQRCTYLIQLDYHRKKIASDLLENVRREEVEKEVLEENLRHKRLQEMKIAEELAERKEEEEEKQHVEEMVRVAKELAIQHAKGLEVKVEVERVRMIVEEEKRREAMESKVMLKMDSESQIIEEHHRRIEDSCVVCKECSATLQHRHTISVRYRKVPAVDVMHFEGIEHPAVVSESTGRNAIVEEVVAEGDEVEGEVDGVKKIVEEEDEHHMLILPLSFIESSGNSITCLPTGISFSQLHQPLTKDMYHELQSEIHILPVRDLRVEKARMSCKQPEEVVSDTCLLLSENELESKESLILQYQVQVLSSDDNDDPAAGFSYQSENSIDPSLQDCTLSVPGDKESQVAIAVTVAVAVAVTPPGVVQLQAVWRSKKARRRIKNALLAARYQDDELDDLFGAEDLNMEETLLSYEDYLAPISLCGGWQPNLPHPEQTENLHGTRMVKALAGGWMVGGTESSMSSSEMKNEREDNDDNNDISSNHSLGGPLVYGDHRRRRQSNKDGLSDPILKHLSFSDNPNMRSTALIESPKRELIHSSSSLSSSSSSLPGVVTSGGSNQRPHTAFTERSSLSESSAEVLPVRHPSHIIGDERVTLSTGGPAQRVNTVSDVRYKSKAYGVSNRDSSADIRETTMSKGGGGAAGMSSSTGSGRGRGGMGRGGGRHKAGRKSVPPAWALTGPQGDEYWT